MTTAFYNSFSLIVSQVVSDSVSFFPKLLAALVVLIIGGALAKTLKKIVVKLLEKVRISSAVEKTPVEHFLKNAELGAKIEDVVGGVFYWIMMLVVINTVASILGLSTLSLILERILGYLPRVISSVIVLFFGVVLAGLVEGMVKGAIRSIDNKAGRVLGKISGYIVVSIAALAAISELGIARDFILVLFVGFIGMITLGGGLALGLGGKKVVESMLSDWHDQLKKDLSKK
jgi:flagellar biosynthesis protein FliQ